MARRKRNKRLAGFGLSKSEHQHRATNHAKDARQWMRGVKTALDIGDCATAIDRLANAAYAIGKTRAHSQSRGLSYIRSIGGGGTSALYGLTRRVVRACSK